MSKQKAVRVNHSTKAEDIVVTMREEMPKALYFFRKEFGGKNKYLKGEDEMTDKAMEEKHDQLTDISEWISPVGNRWETYTHVQYYPKAEYAQSFHYSFIYYETMASCGAFFPMYSPKQTKDGKVKENGKPDGVLVFTAHFFYQMSERTGKAYRSKELIKEFVATKCEHALTADEDGDIIVKFQGGHGFGKELSKNPQVIEVRTYLTDEQLNNSQRRKCQAVDALYEMTRDGLFMKDINVHTAYHRDWTSKEAAQEGLKKLEAAKKLGLDRPMMLMGMVHMAFIRIMEDILHIKVSMQQSAVIAATAGDKCLPLVQKWSFIDGDKMTDEQNAAFKQDLIDTLAKIARELKLKAVNRDTIAARIDEIIADSKRVAENYEKEEPKNI